MPDEPEVTTENLRKLTNELEGVVEEPGSQESATSQSPAEPTAAEPAAPTPPPQGKQGEGTFEQKIQEYLADTQFKNLDDFKKSYKELWANSTKRNAETKPHEPFLKLRNENPQFRAFTDQAAQVFQNPSLLSAYMNPQGQTLSGTPDPRKYDWNTFEGVEKWQTDTLSYARRMAQEDVNARLGQMEQQNRINELRRDFKTKYKDADPDEIQTWLTQEGPNLNPLEVAYRYRNYDNLKAQMLEEARKELNKQVQTASSTKTPAAAASTDSKTINAEDVLNYITKHGSEAAFKKFGQAEVVEVLRNSTF